mgnify:CR=1 FL=1
MNDKQRVAHYAAQQIDSGMLIGLGTGSTANCFIDALVERQQNEALDCQYVASSIVTLQYARQAGLKLVGIETLAYLDLYVDGADEVAPDLSLLKGRGSDLVREKLLAQNSREFWVLIDPSKKVNHIGEKFPVAVEVMPFAVSLVQNSLSHLNIAAVLRKQGDGLHVTSHGCLVLDCQFNNDAPVSIDHQLNAVPGVVEHGIFLLPQTRVFCGEDQTVREMLR